MHKRDAGNFPLSRWLNSSTGSQYGRKGPRADAWLAIQSTIWCTLSYPLPAINLLKTQCKLMMKPILTYGLPAMGICRNFPRTLVFAPKKVLGLDFKHLFMEQEIYRIKDIILYMHLRATTGKLYRTSFEILFIELGLGTNLSKISKESIAGLATLSLATSSLLFLSQHKLVLKHDIKLKIPRQGDSILMSQFLHHNISIPDLARLNRCRLHLQAYFLSDITTRDGIYISDPAWFGEAQFNPIKAQFWPRQLKPPKADWQLRREALPLCFLARGRRLRKPLGSWLFSRSYWHLFFNSSLT